MKKRLVVTFFVVTLASLMSIPAMAQVFTHSVWTNSNGLVIRDAQTGCAYPSFAGFEMATSWTEPFSPTNPADAHFRGVAKAGGAGIACGVRFYDFRLVASSVTGPDNIDGKWDVYRNNVLVCGGCKGTAYGLSQAAGVGNYYKLYIDDPVFGPSTWLYSGYLDVRKDF